jgi:hypothetical protein
MGVYFLWHKKTCGRIMLQVSEDFSKLAVASQSG